MSRQSMSAADTAWLHMDRPANPMVVHSVVLFGGPLEMGTVEELLQRRLVDRFPRFRQRVVEALGRPPVYEDDPSFDIANHVRRLSLPAPGDRAALQDLVSELIAPQLDRSKPLWEANLIEGYEDGAAVLWRIHHCVADGIALGRVLLSVCDEPEGVVVSEPSTRPARSALRRLVDVGSGAISLARRAGGAALHEGMESLVHPRHLRELAGTALRDASVLAKLLGSPAEAPSGLRGPLSGTRRVAWTTPFPLSRLKKVGRRRRVTINDLLVSALAGALNDVFAPGDGLPDEIHALVPFNLRPLDEPVPTDLGNDFALILLELPVGSVPPAERLREVASRMGAIKRSHEAPISYGLLGTIGLTPPWVEERLIDFFTDKASLVVTNVPGPVHEVGFGGVPITNVLVWAPYSGTLGMTVSIYSYAGDVTVGFMADTGLIPDPEPLAWAYEEQLGILVPAGT